MLVKEFTCCLWKILNLAFLFDLRYCQVSVTWVKVWKNEWMKWNTSCWLVIDKVNEERGKLLFWCELGVKCLVVYYSYHNMHTTCWFMGQKQAMKCFLFPFMFLIWFYLQQPFPITTDCCYNFFQKILHDTLNIIRYWGSLTTNG